MRLWQKVLIYPSETFKVVLIILAVLLSLVLLVAIARSAVA
jgi:hypothetical protein